MTDCKLCGHSTSKVVFNDEIWVGTILVSVNVYRECWACGYRWMEKVYDINDR